MTIHEVIAHIRAMEKEATPPPWTAVGHELYYGPEASGVTHQQLARAEDARLIAVMRSWIVNILDLAEKSQ